MPQNSKAAHLLYTYPSNKARLSDLAQNLDTLREGTDVHAQSYEARGSPSSPPDPVSNYVAQVIALEAQIAALRVRTLAIERVIEECRAIPDDYYAKKLAVMTLHYFLKKSPKEVAFILQRHVSTIYRLMEAAVKSVAVSITT